MKKIIYLLLLMSTFAHSQISDTDAKLQYNQTEDLYNQGNYYDASQKAILLKEKMGKWTPKVLYIYIKSAYKSYTDNDLSSSKFNKSTKQFSALDNDCKTFFQLTNNTNYPTEKYKEIQDIQVYFQKMIKQFDVPVEDVVNFLTYCLNSFATSTSASNNPTENVLTITNFSYQGRPYYSEIKGNKTLKFELKDKILYMVVYGVERSSADENFEITRFKIDRLDLSKVISIDDNGNLKGNYTYNSNNEKISAYFDSDMGNISILFKRNSSTEVKKDYYKDDLLRKNKLKEGKYEDFRGKYSSGPVVNVFRYFKTDSQRFIDENYKSQIVKAFSILIDYARNKSN